MRSRRSIIDIWPAYADLFSTLAVLGIFASFFISEKENRINKLNKEVELKQSAFEELQTRCTKINKYFELAELVLEEVKAEIDHLGINVIRTADSLVLSENFIYFDRNDWSKPIFREGKVGEEKFLNLLESLKRSIEKKNARGKLIVYIEGHTDSSQFKTTQYTNWNLSSERASTIVNWIKSKNIDMDIIPIGLADTRPAPFCNILENEENKMACNRRIEIKISPNYSEIERTIQVSNEENIYDIKDSESIMDDVLPDSGLLEIFLDVDGSDQLDAGISGEDVESSEFYYDLEDVNMLDVFDVGLGLINYEKK